MFETVVAMRGTVYEKGYGLIAQKAMRDKNLSPKAKAIYAYLCSFAGSGEDRTAFPGVELMMDELQIRSRDTFYKFRNELEQAGYITVEQDKDERGRYKRCVYHIEAVVTPKEQPCPKNQDTEPCPKNSTTVNQDYISISSKSIKKDLDRQIEQHAAAEIAAASAQISSSIESEDLNQPDEIYEALLRYVPEYIYVADNIRAGIGIVDQLYLMLQQREFKNILSPEVVQIACDHYYNRACRLDNVTGNVYLRESIDKPEGLFHTCYKDAVKLWKARRGRSARELLQATQ